MKRSSADYRKWSLDDWCEFVTQMKYPFTFPRGRRRPSESDFYLTREGAYVEVWSVPLTQENPHWEDYLVRRRFKTAMCRKLNLRLIGLEGQILFRQRPEVYLEHIHAVFAEAGIPLPMRLESWGALCPDRAEEEVGQGD